MAKNTTGANLGFEDKLWAAADKLRGEMKAANDVCQDKSTVITTA